MLLSLLSPLNKVIRNFKPYQVPNISDDVKHQLLDGRVAQVFRRLVLVLGLQHVLHDEDDVLDELRVGLVHDHLE